MPTVANSVTPDGTVPSEEWFASLDRAAMTRVAAALARMRDGNPGDWKSLGDGVFERRIHAGPGYRLDYGRVGEEFVLLLDGGTKKRQGRDIRRAKAYWLEYDERRQRDGDPDEIGGRDDREPGGDG